MDAAMRSGVSLILGTIYNNLHDDAATPRDAPVSTSALTPHGSASGSHP